MVETENRKVSQGFLVRTVGLIGYLLKLPFCSTCIREVQVSSRYQVRVLNGTQHRFTGLWTLCEMLCPEVPSMYWLGLGLVGIVRVRVTS